MPAEFHSKGPLKVDGKDKGWQQPVSVEALQATMAPGGAGKLLCSCTLGSFDLWHRCSEELATFDSIKALKSVLFPNRSARDLHLILHVLITHIPDANDFVTLPPKCLKMIGQNQILDALVLAIMEDMMVMGKSDAEVLKLQDKWWPVMRSLITFIHKEGGAKQRLVLLARNNLELQGTADALVHSALTKSDIAQSMNDELSRQVNGGARVGRKDVTFAQVAKGFG